MRVSEKDFDGIVKRAIKRIPREIKQHLENMIITVKKRPSPAMLKEMGMDPDDSLLGLYDGISLADRSVTDPPLFPDTIFLFQEPLEEMCDTIEELEEEIEITVVHEIAHALGMDDARLAELGYA